MAKKEFEEFEGPVQSAPAQKNKKQSALARELTTPVFKGHRRVFLLCFAFALLLQGLVFMYLQSSKVRDLLSADFKILLSLPAKTSSERVEEIGTFLSGSYEALEVRFISSEDGLALVRGQNPQMAKDFVLLGRSPMPEHFEITLRDYAMPNLANWLQLNIKNNFPEVKIHYKPAAARAIAYSYAVVKFLNVLLALSAAVFFAFVFFVEAFYVCQPAERLRGLAAGGAAWAGSFAAVWIMLFPLKTLAGEFWTLTTAPVQCACAACVLIFGWTLAKWKKF